MSVVPPTPVLVVDDDAALRSLFGTALARAGFDVLTAGDGEGALELLARHRVQLVLLDARLPGIGGREVLAALRASPDTTLLPVIMVTGEDEMEHRVGGLDAGANDYLVKPVDLAELVARVRAQLRTRELWNRAAGESLRRRLDAVRSLSRLRPGGDPSALAREVCERLVATDDIEGVAVYH
ncbi:MAG: response regulator transcription factor, partial [Acidimicrobiales bacterium]